MGIRYYAATDDPDDEIPRGYQRVTLGRIGASGDAVYRVSSDDGTSYLWDARGDGVGKAEGWTPARVVADVPAHDVASFLEAIQAGAAKG